MSRAHSSAYFDVRRAYYHRAITGERLCEAIRLRATTEDRLPDGRPAAASVWPLERDALATKQHRGRIIQRLMPLAAACVRVDQNDRARNVAVVNFQMEFFGEFSGSRKWRI